MGIEFCVRKGCKEVLPFVFGELSFIHVLINLSAFNVYYSYYTLY